MVRPYVLPLGYLFQIYLKNIKKIFFNDLNVYEIKGKKSGGL